MPTMIGQTLGHYRIVEKIGQGGMGVVYRAHDERLERHVAVKVLPEGTLADEASRKRFRKEALALSKLNHPNVATVHDFDTQDGVDFLAMEYISGQTLTERVASGPLPEKEVARLGSQLVEGLAAAHAQGLVHRDLKPGNVRITPDGLLKILDFGLAKSTRSIAVEAVTETATELHGITGTLPYMAPEQLQGEPVDTRTDLYALGTVLYEMSTGQRPFPETHGPQLIAAILQQVPRPPREVNRHVSVGLESIILKALEKDPERRYQSAGELRVDFKRLSGPGPFLAAPRRKRLARRQVVALAGVALVALLVGLNLGELRNRFLGTATPPRIESIVVLPLQNVSGDPEQDYFADGMTEALITNLGQIRALRVISRTSAMRFKGADTPLVEIARQLNVDAVVEGSAQRVGQEAGITVRLIEAATEQQLWSQAFQRDFSNLLVLQSELARAIAQEIEIAMTPQEEARLAVEDAVDPETYEAYLRGMFYLSDPAQREKGLAYLHEAIDRDPADAAAYAGLALGYATLGHGPAPPPDAWPRARAAALRAVQLDPTLAEAHAALADVKLYYEWDWAGAEQAFQRARELNPGLAMNHYHYAWYHALFGRMDEAIVEHERAQELDPLRPLHTAWLGGLYMWERRYEEAIAEARKSFEIRPDFAIGWLVLGLVYTDQGRYEEAIAAHQKLAEVAPNWRWVLGRTYAMAGQTDEARNILAEFEEEEATPWNAFARVSLYAALGDKDEAFRWLAYEQPHAFVPWIAADPLFEAMREWDDPRFQDFLRRLNFPP